MNDDLDRCPHGRHAGDVCAGWRGPGDYDGGCRGGYSLGNPYLQPGQRIGTSLHGAPIHAPGPCMAHDCPMTGTQEFTVGERPPGVQGLDGWPDGAPELADDALPDEGVPEGAVVRFCGRHAQQLREAAEPWLAQPATVYGIRPHRPMTFAEHELARRAAESWRPNPEAPRQLRETLDEEP